MTIERFGKQANLYEYEIANLNAQIIVLNSEANDLSKASTKTESAQEES
jgi:hypothetical protein